MSSQPPINTPGYDRSTKEDNMVVNEVAYDTKRPTRLPCHARSCSTCSTATTATIDSTSSEFDHVSRQTSAITEYEAGWKDEFEEPAYNIDALAISNASTSLDSGPKCLPYPPLTDTIRDFIHRLPHTTFKPLEPSEWAPGVDCHCCNFAPQVLRSPDASEDGDAFLHGCTTCSLRLCSECVATITSDPCRGSLRRLMTKRARWKWGFSESFLDEVSEAERRHGPPRLLKAAEWPWMADFGHRPKRRSKLSKCILASQQYDWFLYEHDGRMTTVLESEEEEGSDREESDANDDDDAEGLTMEVRRPWRSQEEMERCRERRRLQFDQRRALAARGRNLEKKMQDVKEKPAEMRKSREKEIVLQESSDGDIGEVVPLSAIGLLGGLFAGRRWRIRGFGRSEEPKITQIDTEKEKSAVLDVD